MRHRVRALGSGAARPARGVVLLALVLAALALVPAAVVAAAASDRLAAANAVAVAAGDVDTVHLADVRTFGEILVRNLSAAAALVAGAPLAGVPTLVGSIVLAFGVGAGMRAVVTALGPEETAARILAYAPLELLGVVLAAAAGFAPLASVVLDRLGPAAGRSLAVATSHGLRVAVRLAGLALACLVVAAGVESILIARSPH